MDVGCIRSSVLVAAAAAVIADVGSCSVKLEMEEGMTDVGCIRSSAAKAVVVVVEVAVAIILAVVEAVVDSYSVKL